MKITKYFKQSRYLFGIFVVIAIGVFGLSSSLPAYACSMQVAKPGACLPGVVENGLPGGIQTAVDWDTSCRTHIGSPPYSTARFNSDGSGTLRDGINTGASYKWMTWLSARNRGNTTVPITITNPNSIPLQINEVVFICGPLVVPNLSPTYPFCSTAITGATFANDNQRWVTSTSNENDRAPNPVHSGCTYPSQTLTRTLITSLTVDPLNTTFGGTVNGSNLQFINRRDEDSRYWSGTSPVTYTPASTITSNGQVRIIMKYKKYTGYHSTDENKATKNCNGGGPEGVIGPLNISTCLERTDELFLTFVLANNYSLNPAISISPTLLLPGQTDISVNPSVNNTGSTASTPNVAWSVTRFIVNAGANYTTNAGSLDPCSQFGGYRAGSCSTINSGNFTFPVGNTALGSLVNSVGAEPAGTSFCYTISVNPGSHISLTWRHATPVCSIIAKAPQVQIWGGDVRVGNSFLGSAGNVSTKASILTTSASNISGRLYGSWGEYGMLSPALGTVNSASGGALSGSTGGISTLSAAQQNVLTFANTSPPYGRWGTPGKFPSIVTSAAFAGGATVPAASINIGTRSGIINLTHAGTVRVSGTLNAGTKKLVLKSTGDIEIDGDILYGNASFSSAADVQQLIIIARNIRINPNVSVVNAWLIAQPSGGSGGVISTCGSPGTPDYFTGLRVGDACEARQLKINGIVMATELQLRRTHGADTLNGPAKSSEIINMRPDAYLWAQAQSSASGQIDTIMTTELSPRF